MTADSGASDRLTAGDPLEQYDYGSHWVSEQISRGALGIQHPLLVSVLKFGLVWNLLAAAYLAVADTTFSPGYLVASGLGLLWVNIAPYLIWYYDERVLPSFFERLGEILPEEASVDELAEKYTTMFAEPQPLVAAFWTVGTVAIVFAGTDVLRAQGMVGTGSVFIWTTYAYALFIGLVLSHGFMGPVLTLRLIGEVAEADLQIDPLHPDNLGGLSTVGYCAIRTTLLYSTASLFLPLLFRFSAASASGIVIFAFATVYVCTILGTFLYPTLRVSLRAHTLRDTALERIRREYRQVEAEMQTPDRDELSELNRRLELQRLQTKYQNFNSVSLYPLQTSILARLAGSVFLPLLFIFVEFYVPKLI
ncbi:hypothetical protein [Natronomonas sp. EA1]|uniref:hypothetical protein n=1 Tax=Natronomonas sp. EA1 TaxID=3421655 RepID=UPI003EBF53F0